MSEGKQPNGPRAIVHLDLDAFFASVEVLLDSSLKGKPVVVGGRPRERGVVAAASYPARKYGVRSAMPMGRALDLCPDLVIVPPHYAMYTRYSRQVMALVREAAPLVEQVSIDEAYLDLTALISDWEEAVERARDLQARVQSELDLSASLGVATSKLVAKVASDRDKPGGLTVVRPGEEAAFLAPLPVRVLWGVGPVTAARLRDLRVTTVGDLAQREESELVGLFGKHGAAMARHARGEDNRPVVAKHETKQVSQERTFARDVGQLETLKGHLWRMCKRVADRLHRLERAAGTVGIKMRYADFTTLTRQTSLLVPTDEDVEIYRAALALLERTWERDRAVRLLGVAATNLTVPTGQLSFL